MVTPYILFNVSVRLEIQNFEYLLHSFSSWSGAFVVISRGNRILRCQLKWLPFKFTTASHFWENSNRSQFWGYVSQQCFTRETVFKENFTREVCYEIPAKINPHRPANYAKSSSSKKLLEPTHYMKHPVPARWTRILATDTSYNKWTLVMAGLYDVHIAGISYRTSLIKTSLARSLNIVKANTSLNLSGNSWKSISVEIYYEGLGTIWKDIIE